jgi:hypothetical protein
MRTKSSLRITLTPLLIVAIVAAAVERDSVRGSKQDRLSSSSAALPARFLAPTQAVMDFDGDRFPDRAELTSNGVYKHIHLTLSSPWATNLHFSTESPQPGSIRAEDIDHDGDNDLIWVSDRLPAQSTLWLNSGIGGFARVTDTSAYIPDSNHIIADESRSGIFASHINEQLLTTGTSGDSLLTRSDGRLQAALRSVTLPGGRNCAAELSPCITRYPKRGPPPNFPDSVPHIIIDDRFSRHSASCLA